MQAAYCVLLNCKKNVCEEEVKINIILKIYQYKKVKGGLFFFFFWSCKLLVLQKRDDFYRLSGLSGHHLPQECSITRGHEANTQTSKGTNTVKAKQPLSCR